jgi:nucleotide-binding universal stress UspA family protein
MVTNRSRHQPWKVLVAVDGSRGSAAALRFAADLAACSSARVVVLTVMTMSASKSEELVRANRVLDAATETLRRAGVLSEQRAVIIPRSGSIPEAIRRESNRMRADLVVIGSEGRDTLREWVVGGVALQLLYLSHRPVLVVRPPRRRNVTKADVSVYAARQVIPHSGSRRGGGP